MQAITKNAQQLNSIADLFYKGVPVIIGDENIDHLPFALQDFTCMCIEAVYVFDFFKRGFNFVANRDLFLCGHNVKEALSLGYDFFSKVIHNKDLTMFAEMHSATLQYLCSIERPNEINYFSFATRFKNKAGYIMVDQKLKPVFVNGQLRFGLCLLSNTVLEEPGHLRAYYYNNIDYDEYSLKNRKWQKKAIPSLTEQEKAVLIWAKQGKTNKQIADIINVEHQTVRNINNTLYRKLNVNSMIKAIVFASNLHLIYMSDNTLKHKKSLKAVKQKQRRPMTSNKLLILQEELNKGKSINSIAKQMNLAEFTIRYAIKTGKLTKPKFVNL